MRYPPRIIFCTTCKNRTPHLERTLPQNLRDNADYWNCAFVVLDYNSPDHLRDYLREHHQDDILGGRLIVYSYREPGPFQMAHAKNMAHRLGILEGADILVNLDADNFTGPGFASYVAEQFRESDHIFLWSRMVKGDTPRGINGRLAYTSKAFLNLGGYDEQFQTWSPDDKDLHLRLRRSGLAPREIDRRFLDCIPHNDKMRFREYQHVSSHEGCEDVYLESMHSSDTTVANYGAFGEGRAWRNLDFNAPPAVLRAIPTRIFGIGMHKTATTSLHAALTILGYDSAHWMSAGWAKAIWEEMRTWGTSRTLERHYALCDLPIPLLYRELDKAYPGSKFILTIRDEAKWIESVKNHWNPDHNIYRAGWDTDPFTHRIHKELYGQKNFDADLFLKRYRQHNGDVVEYFWNRPKDLHIMEMDQQPGWEPLCQFLDRPVPAVEYPRKFVTVRGVLHGHGEGI